MEIISWAISRNVMWPSWDPTCHIRNCSQMFTVLWSPAVVYVYISSSELQPFLMSPEKLRLVRMPFWHNLQSVSNGIYFTHYIHWSVLIFLWYFCLHLKNRRKKNMTLWHNIFYNKQLNKTSGILALKTCSIIVTFLTAKIPKVMFSPV